MNICGIEFPLGTCITLVTNSKAHSNFGPFEVGRHFSTEKNGWIKFTNNKEWTEGYVTFTDGDVLEMYIDPSTITKVVVSKNRFPTPEKDEADDPTWNYIVT